MRVLALETACSGGAAAVLDGERLLAAEGPLPTGETARRLPGVVAALLSAAGWRPSDVELIAVARGPGSFTGLRMGVTFAKTLAYAVGAGLAGVDTCWAIAAQALAESPPGARAWAVLDAQRGDLFAALAAREGPPGAGVAAVRLLAPTALCPRAEWLTRAAESAAPGADDVLTAGPVVAALASQLPRGLRSAPPEQWLPRAETIGRLGAAAWRAGVREDASAFAPRYHRASAAEEKRRPEGP